MKKNLLPFFLMLSFFPVALSAQKVPDDILKTVIQSYTELGQTLEKSLMPDFTRAHPTQMFTYVPCYPGKVLTVLSITAQKPADWKFKVRMDDHVFPKTNELSEVVLSGKTYCMNWILAGVSANTPNSENCLTVIAYDGDNIDLPVYTYIFSTQK